MNITNSYWGLTSGLWREMLLEIRCVQKSFTFCGVFSSPDAKRTTLRFPDQIHQFPTISTKFAKILFNDFSKTPWAFWLKQSIFFNSIFFSWRAKQGHQETSLSSKMRCESLFQKWGNFPPPCSHLPSGHSEKWEKLWQEHPKPNHLGSKVWSCNEHKYEKFLEHEALFVFLVWVGKAPNGVW